MAKERFFSTTKYSWDRERRGVSKRPWRFWGTTMDGKHGAIPYRAYGDEVRAHNGAMIDVRWGEFRAIEVYDVRTGNESGTYSLKPGQKFPSFSAPESSNIIKLLIKKGLIDA